MAFEDFEKPTGLVVISGTHSAGKTTLFDDLQEHLPQLGCSVTFCEEAATAYTKTHPGKQRVLTDQYTLEDQIIIEVNNFSSIAGAIDNNIREGSIGAGGLVVADRSPLDGLVYAALKSGRDQSLVSMDAVFKSAQGIPGNTVSGLFLPWSDWVKKFTQRYVDLVIIPDHTEVPLEDNGIRETDIDFRDEIAANIMRLYEETVGPERMLRVAGTRAERLHIASLTIRELILKIGREA